MNKYLPFIVFGVVNILFFLSAYYYPIVRDEFYYLDKETSVNFFKEYYNSYLFGNPRIGQLMGNIVGRDWLLRAIFGTILFNLFFLLVYLNVFRKLPNYKSSSDIAKLLMIIGPFTLLIYVFGEMFYYVPFSSNYTFLMCFHLLFVFVMMEYFLFRRNILENKYFIIPIILILGLISGMGNEHIPPVLIAFCTIGSVWYLLKYRKLPNYKIIIYQFSLLLGYALLFFAPANSVKYKTLGKQESTFSSSDYFDNLRNVLNYFRYFNIELIVIFVVVSVIAIQQFKKGNLSKILITKCILILILGFLTVPIVAYAPLSGTRLLFFCNTMIFVFIFTVFFNLNKNRFAENIFLSITSVYLIVFFIFSSIISLNGRKNFEEVLSEIEKQKISTKEIILPKSFNYYTPQLHSFNCRFFIDNGLNYIDNNPLEDNSQERELKIYLKLKSISTR